jgi:hypothetical protein
MTIQLVILRSMEHPDQTVVFPYDDQPIFSDPQKEVLRFARDQIRSGKRKYICHAVSDYVEVIEKAAGVASAKAKATVSEVNDKIQVLMNFDGALGPADYSLTFDEFRDRYRDSQRRLGVEVVLADITLTRITWLTFLIDYC